MKGFLEGNRRRQPQRIPCATSRPHIRHRRGNVEGVTFFMFEPVEFLSPMDLEPLFLEIDRDGPEAIILATNDPRLKFGGLGL
jgi:hypothetical protein